MICVKASRNQGSAEWNSRLDTCGSDKNSDTGGEHCTATHSRAGPAVSVWRDCLPPAGRTSPCWRCRACWWLCQSDCRSRLRQSGLEGDLSQPRSNRVALGSSSGTPTILNTDLAALSGIPSSSAPGRAAR